MTNPKSDAEPLSEGRGSQQRVAGALHEVSNALTVVLGWLDRADEAPSLDQMKQAVEVAREHARRGQTLARDGLGASVARGPTRHLASELARFAATSVEPQADARRVRIVTNVDEDRDGRVDGDGAVLQVLTNLLLNALHFSPAGGSIRLEARAEGAVVRFVVEDEGPGVPHGLVPDLFDRGVSTRPGGAGIGLPLSRRLARQHGGELRLDNPGCNGARFILQWPSAPDARVLPIGVSTGRDPEHSPLAGSRVLMIEDDAAIVALVQLTLEARGAVVIPVDSPSAVDQVLSQRPLFDLVLLDLSPVSSRLSEVLGRLKDLSPDAPVLLMSGEPTGIPREAEGCIHTWLRKPFDMSQLVDLTERALAGHQD